MNGEFELMNMEGSWGIYTENDIIGSAEFLCCLLQISEFNRQMLSFFFGSDKSKK